MTHLKLLLFTFAFLFLVVFPIVVQFGYSHDPDQQILKANARLERLHDCRIAAASPAPSPSIIQALRPNFNSSTCSTKHGPIPTFFVVVVSLKRSLERRAAMTKKLDDELVRDYAIIDGVDGFRMDDDTFAREVFRDMPFPLLSLFPKLQLDGHHGTKGVWLSTMKALTFAQQNTKATYTIVLQDDAEIDELGPFVPNIESILASAPYRDPLYGMNRTELVSDMIWLDKRSDSTDISGTMCCLAGAAYRTKKIPDILRLMHPLGSTVFHSPISDNLFDLFTSTLCRKEIACHLSWMVGSGRFESTISTAETALLAVPRNESIHYTFANGTYDPYS
eukprot:c9052_g1_i1.p1 GENE.c9052_g1_i1~~c9052_g1_i1.p1  ORF type:complete len:335 (+),score=18.30 c9052_g1_i1:81-1085(+)